MYIFLGIPQPSSPKNYIKGGPILGDQIIVGITVRESDTQMRTLLAAIEDCEARRSHGRTRYARGAGRSFNTPIGAYARIDANGALQLTGLVASMDGTFLLKRRLTEAIIEAPAVGRGLGLNLKADSPSTIFW